MSPAMLLKLSSRPSLVPHLSDKQLKVGGLGNAIVDNSVWQGLGLDLAPESWVEAHQFCIEAHHTD